jgi:hypothetical protein
LVSTDDGDVTKATKHNGSARAMIPFVAPATNVHRTNVASDKVSHILQSEVEEEASRFIQRQSELHPAAI